jgi:hypothetical protein
MATGPPLKTATMKKWVFPVIAAGLLCSCKGETTYMKQVQNQTNLELEVSFMNDVSGEMETHVIEPHGTQVVFYETVEGAEEGALPCTQDISDMMLTVQTPRIVAVDPMSDDNWEYESSEKTMGGVVNHTCRLVITHEDIE